ncbi:MAG: carboxymuconolactone decarboxylase family protein, partial [Candidatus Acidiferrales bacterium]
VTLIAERHVPEDVYERATKQFTPEEMVNLTMAIITINAWNRLSIAFGAVPGSYTPKIEKAITGS